MDTEAKPPPEPPVKEPDVQPDPAPVAPVESVTSPFTPGSRDEDRDPFRSDSVDHNAEGEFILDRALTPPKKDADQSEGETPSEGSEG